LFQELCGKEEESRSGIEALCDKNCMEKIAFKWWKHTDRSNLETVVKKVDDFLSKFFEVLGSAKPGL
jgi:hypothetical protein